MKRKGVRDNDGVYKENVQRYQILCIVWRQLSTRLTNKN
jgi:hypothetical protein